MSEHRRSSLTGRLLTALTWAVLLFGLWLWGSEVTGLRGTGSDGGSVATAGDAGAAGQQPAVRLPPAQRPLARAVPQRIDIPRLGVQAPVVARGLDTRGAVASPPLDQPGVVSWYAAGTAPGSAGAALMVGHVDTRTRPAVFHRLGTLRPGDTVRVVRGDGKVARFTVEDVRTLPRDGFDARQAYGVRRAGRAELRLITCGGTFDRAHRRYSANVVVSAYLTGGSDGRRAVAPGTRPGRRPALPGAADRAGPRPRALGLRE
ncbi:class F sortase [Streptomyces mangrovisoli]|uniref:class F sortase n=1 Tax=Streptomyces mangrovisoli TaxID=1428628 RepID=UPI0009A0EFED